VANWVPTAWKSEFVYDDNHRRRIERNYSWNGSAWTLTWKGSSLNTVRIPTATPTTPFFVHLRELGFSSVKKNPEIRFCIVASLILPLTARNIWSAFAMLVIAGFTSYDSYGSGRVGRRSFRFAERGGKSEHHRARCHVTSVPPRIYVGGSAARRADGQCHREYTAQAVFDSQGKGEKVV
jgi:hypothetical protein